MIESPKTINLLIDEIHKEKGIISNVVNGGSHILTNTIPLLFKDYKFNYIPSYFAKETKNWVYPVVILNITFISLLLASSSSRSDILSLIISNRDIICIFVIIYIRLTVWQTLILALSCISSGTFSFIPPKNFTGISRRPKLIFISLSSATTFSSMMHYILK